MNLFVYEHITSGYFIDQELPDTLIREGIKMLEAVVNDCASLSSINVHIIYDQRLSNHLNFKPASNLSISSIKDKQQFKNHWLKQLKTADNVLIIAPETEGILSELQQQAYQLNQKVIGSSPKAISLSSNKLLCFKHLALYGLTQPQTYLASQWQQEPFESNKGYIVKPLDGAGCLDTFIITTSTELDSYLASKNLFELEHAIIQPYINGQHLSLCVLISNNSAKVLSINEQLIEQSNNIVEFKGVIINEYQNHPILTPSYTSNLLTRIIKAIPGLDGFIGVDLIVDGSKAYIIDINPRITTAYVGLAESIGINPMSLLLTPNKNELEELNLTHPAKAIEVRL